MPLMSPSEAMIQQPRDVNTTAPIIHGWVSSPNGRGTIDILKLCLATVFLCTYSVLFLNIKHCPTRLDLIIYKTKWVVFTIFFPELTTAIAAEQWRSARESVGEFSKLRDRLEVQRKEAGQKQSNVALDRTIARMQEVPWTTRHAFFADMGGIRLRCPDCPDFPINSVHFLWLIDNGHIEYPELAEKTIRDKNKADTLSRGITVLQVAWFTVQIIARGIRHMYITTLELSTLAFVCCTLHTFWFWGNKPFDVAEPITIACEKELRAIVRDAKPNIGKRPNYSKTPLEFLDLEARTSYVETFFYCMTVALNQDEKVSPQPASSFPNSTVSHRGMKAVDIMYGYVFGVLYFGIHLVAWSFHFPSHTESWLWRSSSITLASLAAMYEFGCWPGNYIGKYFLPGSPNTAIEIGRALPKRVVRLFMWPFLIVSFCARSYIIVEGFVGLRALPETAFESVDWWSFVPHF